MRRLARAFAATSAISSESRSLAKLCFVLFGCMLKYELKLSVVSNFSWSYHFFSSKTNSVSKTSRKKVVS